MVRDAHPTSVPAAGRADSAGGVDRTESAEDTEVAGQPTGEDWQHASAQRIRSSAQDRENPTVEAAGRSGRAKAQTTGDE